MLHAAAFHNKTYTYTRCPRNKCNPVYVAINLANNVGF